MYACRRQPEGRLHDQWTTSPAWQSVKPVNAPIANRGIGVRVFPLTAISNTPDRMLNVGACP